MLGGGSSEVSAVVADAGWSSSEVSAVVVSGAWLKSSLGYVQREGDELILTYIASQLGYWVAAMSPLNTGD